MKAPCGQEPEEAITNATRVWPATSLPDARKPTITSAFGKRGMPPRMHFGVDICVPWLNADPEWPGGIKRLGVRRWGWPPGWPALATEAGRVVKAGRIDTGWRVWIRGERSGYFIGTFHLTELFVELGEDVAVANRIGTIGANPLDKQGAVHIHLQVADGGPTNAMSIDPAPYLAGAVMLPPLPAR